MLALNMCCVLGSCVVSAVNLILAVRAVSKVFMSILPFYQGGLSRLYNVRSSSFASSDPSRNSKLDILVKLIVNSVVHRSAAQLLDIDVFWLEKLQKLLLKCAKDVSS